MLEHVTNEMYNPRQCFDGTSSERFPVPDDVV